MANTGDVKQQQVVLAAIDKWPSQGRSLHVYYYKHLLSATVTGSYYWEKTSLEDTVNNDDDDYLTNVPKLWNTTVTEMKFMWLSRCLES